MAELAWKTFNLLSLSTSPADRGRVAAPGASHWYNCVSVRLCMDKLYGHVKAPRWNRQSRCLRWVPALTPPPTPRHT